MREAAATGRDAAGLSTRCPAPRPPASRPGPRRGRCGREVRQRSLGRSGLRPEGRSAGRAQTRGPRPPPLAAGLHPALPARSGPVPPLGRFRFRFPGTVVKENESGRGQALRGCRRGEGRRVRGGRPGAGSREPGPQPPPVEMAARPGLLHTVCSPKAGRQRNKEMDSMGTWCLPFTPACARSTQACVSGTMLHTCNSYSLHRNLVLLLILCYKYANQGSQ
nr:WAS/WASL-interacting protein family member 1-like isoform X17 [Manis javanica]